MQRADRPETHRRRALPRIGELERIADRETLLPDLQSGNVAEFDEREVGRAAGLEQAQVADGIGADQIADVIFALSEDAHRPLLAVAGHVMVGKNVAVGADDNARTAADKRKRAGRFFDDARQLGLDAKRHVERLGIGFGGGEERG